MDTAPTDLFTTVTVSMPVWLLAATLGAWLVAGQVALLQLLPFARRLTQDWRQRRRDRRWTAALIEHLAAELREQHVR